MASSQLLIREHLIKHGYIKTGPPSALPPFRTRYDEYMSEHYPHHCWYSTPPEKLKAFFKTKGATDDNLQEYLERYNKRWDEMIANSPNGRLLMVGEKPQSDSNEEILYLQIPDSKLAIRIWPGGMQYHEGYCLDLIDIPKNIPVNTPDDWIFSNVPYPGGSSFGSKLCSWQETFANLPGLLRLPGDEKYSVLESSRIVLLRPGKAPFYFEIPTRRVPFPQPQATFPVLN